MKQIFLAISVAALIGSVGLAQQAAKPESQTSPAAAAPQAARSAPTKIGVVDLVRALSETVEGKREFGEVQDWATKQSDELRKQESDYNALRNQYMQEQLKLSPEARAGMEQRLQDSETRLRRRQEDLNQELTERRQGILNRLGGKMQQVIFQHAQQNNYLAVLIAQEGVFAYVAPAGDLTDELVKLYDAKFPVAAVAAPKK